MTIDERALAQLPLFARFGDDDLREIAPRVRERAFSSGQTIVLEGEPCRAVYFVVRGVVRSYRLSREGREQVLAYLGPGGLFNLVSVLDGEPAMVSVGGVTEGMLYAVPCDHFRWIVREYHQAALAVTERLASDVRRLSDMVEDLALHTVRVRLARFLLTQAEHPQPPSFQWTQAEIAAHIGTVREMVGRTLRTFAADGLIRQEQGRIIVKDRERLEREAAGV